MGQLTIEHLAPYLPYGLKLYDVYDNMQTKLLGIKEDEALLCFVLDGGDEDWCNYTAFKPYLRDLSQLTQEIEHNGERFVPIIELAKIAESDNWLDNEVRYAATETTHAVGWTKDDTRHVFAYSTAHNGFYLECNPYRQLIIANQHKLFQKMAEWHMDFQGLIEQGLALPIQ